MKAMVLLFAFYLYFVNSAFKHNLSSAERGRVGVMVKTGTRFFLVIVGVYN